MAAKKVVNKKPVPKKAANKIAKAAPKQAASKKTAASKKPAKPPAKAKKTAKPPAKAKAKVASQKTNAAPKRAVAGAPKHYEQEAMAVASIDPQVAAERRDALATKAAQARPRVETLGEITAPSGKLALFDIGLVGFMPRDVLESTIVKVDVPKDRPLTVTGTRVGKGRFAECWDHVTVDLADGEVTHAKKLGSAAVDFARIVLMDHAALDHWQHDDSLDGKADVVFWGRDEVQLAQEMKAPRTKEGYGWTNLALMDAESKVFDAECVKADKNFVLNIDYRPHSHHFQALAKARAGTTGAGVLELAGTRMMLMFTSWGDGVFPIFLDLDADDNPVRVRVQLALPEANAAIDAVTA